MSALVTEQSIVSFVSLLFFLLFCRDQEAKAGR